MDRLGAHRRGRSGRGPLLSPIVRVLALALLAGCSGEFDPDARWYVCAPDSPSDCLPGYACLPLEGADVSVCQSTGQAGDVADGEDTDTDATTDGADIVEPSDPGAIDPGPVADETQTGGGGDTGLDTGDPCTTGECETEGCVQSPVPEPFFCDDGDPCTSVDLCVAGVCAGSGECTEEPLNVEGFVGTVNGALNGAPTIAALGGSYAVRWTTADAARLRFTDEEGSRLGVETSLWSNEATWNLGMASLGGSELLASASRSRRPAATPAVAA